MATYAIGDIQACLGGLEKLLSEIRFAPAHDRLLFCGDLVGRGPDAAATLRQLRALGPAATTVLGNHDLHLLALAARGDTPKTEDRLDALLAGSDAETLLDWLATQRLAWHEPAHRALLVHAGLAPQWTARQALELAKEVEVELRSPQRRTALLKAMYGDEPRQWSEHLRGHDRLRCTINILTRARVCDAQGNFEYRYKRAAAGAPSGLLPWFAIPGRRSRRTTVLFGHWSTLEQVHWPQWNVYGLDSGYLWGGKLTALRLEDRQLFAVKAPAANARIKPEN